MSLAPNLTDEDRQHIDNVAYAIACVMARKNLVEMLGDIVIEPRQREVRVHTIAVLLALDLREEAMAAINVSGEAVRL